MICFTHNLKQSAAQGASAESTHKGVNQRSKDVTQTQQQRPELPTVTLTWHASTYKVQTPPTATSNAYRSQDSGRWFWFCCCFKKKKNFFFRLSYFLLCSFLFSLVLSFFLSI